MERLPKVAIYLGMGIGLTIFSLVMFAILPSVVENSSRDWDRALGTSLTDEDVKALFYADPAYTVFKEKYPDANESYENRGDGRLHLIMFNYTNLNEIRLDMRYDSHRENIRIDISCQVNIPGNERDLRREVSGDGAADFIENIDCLNFKMPSFIAPTIIEPEPLD